MIRWQISKSIKVVKFNTCTGSSMGKRVREDIDISHTGSNRKQVRKDILQWLPFPVMEEIKNSYGKILRAYMVFVLEAKEIRLRVPVL